MKTILLISRKMDLASSTTIHNFASDYHKILLEYTEVSDCLRDKMWKGWVCDDFHKASVFLPVRRRISCETTDWQQVAQLQLLMLSFDTELKSRHFRLFPPGTASCQQLVSTVTKTESHYATER